jgi:hypothetical protein
LLMTCDCILQFDVSNGIYHDLPSPNLTLW